MATRLFIFWKKYMLHALIRRLTSILFRSKTFAYHFVIFRTSLVPIAVYLVCTMICYTTLSYQKYRLNNSVQTSNPNQLQVVHQANHNICPDGRIKKIYSSKILLIQVIISIVGVELTSHKKVMFKAGIPVLRLQVATSLHMIIPFLFKHSIKDLIKFVNDM